MKRHFGSTLLVVGFLASHLAWAQFFFTETPQTVHSDSFTRIDNLGMNVGDPTGSDIQTRMQLGSDGSNVSFPSVIVTYQETIGIEGFFVDPNNPLSEQQPSASGTITLGGTLEFQSVLSTSITPLDANRFTISNDDFSQNLGTSDQTELTGTYDISIFSEVGSEEFDGSFTVSPSWNRRIQDSGDITFNTRLPSGAVSFTDASFEFYTEDAALFDISGPLSGISVSVALDASFFTPDPFTLIPEPSHYALTMAALLVGFIALRRASFFEKT